MVREGLIAAAVLALLASCTEPEALRDVEPPRVASTTPPPAPRELRGAWVASVANIDWPSRPGLPVAAQKEEIVRIVDRAQAIGLNALIVQVRPAADALYPSPLEPWSEYLTGEQGKPPEPFYDPLAFWIEEAHKRGIELHAWFNPYRARHHSAKAPLADSHIARTNPAIVKPYGNLLWMDPGEPAAARRTVDVIVDVVRRYDVDAVHIDDYFYPYPIGDLEFPDEPSWRAYLAAGGALVREDWRRQNVNALIERIHGAVHREKPWVRFGVSPFGVGRPDRRPPGISGFSQYDKIYADVELWLARGWLDYLAPQLYWPIDSPGQAFAPLLDYWQRENVLGRHVWPGFFTSQIDATAKSWVPDEILGELAIARAKSSHGHIHFSMAALLENRKGIADRLRTGPYTSAALVPETPWLEGPAPPVPNATARIVTDKIVIAVEDSPAWLHAVWARHGTIWKFHVASGAAREIRLDASSRDVPIDALVVSAVNRLGTESARVTVPVQR